MEMHGNTQTNCMDFVTQPIFELQNANKMADYKKISTRPQSLNAVEVWKVLLLYS